MAEQVFTLGLSQVIVGEKQPDGAVIDESLQEKIGMVYEGTCGLNQAESEVTEHKEEGAAAPAIVFTQKQPIILTFSLMNMDIDMMVKYIGGIKIPGVGGKPDMWGFDGSETVDNYSIRILPKHGLAFYVPNAKIDAVVTGEMTSEGIFLVAFTITPLAVSDPVKKSFYSYVQDVG